MTYSTHATILPQQDLVQTPKLHKYAYIDILRGLAILGVVAVHASQHVEDLNIIVASLFNYGQLGVQLFFVASAITLCLSGSQRKEKSFANFYIRRFFRIAPLFYLAIPFYFFWRVFVGYYEFGVLAVPQNYSVRGVLETVFFVHGFDPKNFNFAVPGGWSIAAEMSFYAIFPAIFLLQSKYKKAKFILLTAVVFLVCLSIKNFFIYDLQQALVEKGLIHKFSLEHDFLEASILNQISVFLVGVICFQYISCQRKAPNFSNKIVVLSFPLMVLSCYLLNSKSYIHTPFTGLLNPVLSAVAFSIISIKLSTIDEFSSRASKILVKVGQLSFSMYILHFFVLDVVDFVFDASVYRFVGIPEIRLIILYPVVLMLTFFLAKVTYNNIEKKGVEVGSSLIRKINQRRRPIEAVL